MVKKEFLEAGQVVSTHGIRGELRVQPWCDSAEQFCTLKRLFLQEGGAPVRVVSRPHKRVALVKMDGVDTVEAAERLRGRTLYAARADFRLPEGRYFIEDLLGLRVEDETTGEVYGTLTDVSETGANNVYHMRTPSGREILIPAIPGVVRSVDIDGGVIRIFPMKGLLDDEN